jgi:hypothetical protein
VGSNPTSSAILIRAMRFAGRVLRPTSDVRRWRGEGGPGRIARARPGTIARGLAR